MNRLPNKIGFDIPDTAPADCKNLTDMVESIVAIELLLRKMLSILGLVRNGEIQDCSDSPHCLSFNCIYDPVPKACINGELLEENVSIYLQLIQTYQSQLKELLKLDKN